ncbi:unnamed protein product [Amoebophrya sp. A25]|nr:unnamed protein product [Amoebophrya sp. A25]|eukprot:GSA25T00012944001.1
MTFSSKGLIFATAVACYTSYFEGASALVVKKEHQQHQHKTSLDIAQTIAASIKASAESKKNTLANRLALLERDGKKRQAPAAAEGVPPKADTSVDAAGYEADWQKEHKSGPYPEGAEGKQHHSAYGSDVKPVVERQLFFNSWFFWISATVFTCLLAAGGLKYYMGRA